MKGSTEMLLPDDDNIDIENTLMSLYKKCAKEWGWIPKDIDETNLETLMDFLFFKESIDQNLKVIEGKVYKRAEKPPLWL